LYVDVVIIGGVWFPHNLVYRSISSIPKYFDTLVRQLASIFVEGLAGNN